MYEHLKGKTLMVMDRTALAACAVKRAKEMGIRTVVANFYKTEDSPSKQLADVAIDIDISNIAPGRYYFIPDIFSDDGTGRHLSYDHPSCNIVFEIVEDDAELEAVATVFENLLEDIDLV